MKTQNFGNKRIAMFTDIHFGKKGNSTQHNQDCLDFVTWFCDKVKQDGKVTHIAFLGDWFENRNAINVMTMTYANKALKLLNSLNIPVYIIIGNHDLYHRESRSVYSTEVFAELYNIVLISEPTIIEDMLICPFLFKHEYPDLAKYSGVKYWLGHFEFRNFVITGTDRKMEHGPEHTTFKNPKYIFSGHFHKRQTRDNVVYIGNTFPMDYGDDGDNERGMCFLDTSNDEVWFENWEDAPSYCKIRLSNVLSGNFDFPKKCRVRCIIDMEIVYSEAQALRSEMVKELGLREFSLEENSLERKSAIAGAEAEALEEFDLSTLNDAVVKMLKTGVTATSTINADKLVEIYEAL